MPEKAGLSASIHTKKGHLYAVIQYKENGKHKSAWRSLGLPENAPQSKIKKAYREAVGAFEEELDRRRMEEAEDPNAIPIITYLNQYLARVCNELQLNTIRSYRQLIHSGITEYFSTSLKSQSTT